MKRFLILVLLLVTALSVPLAVAEPAQPDTIILAFTRQPDSLFIDYAATATASYAMAVLYNSLVGADAEGNFVPELAESWEVSEDQRTWTFHLREDVLWHDGEPFTAEDVKFTFEFSSDPAYTGSAFFSNIEGAAARQSGDADEVSGVQVIDPLTVTITTSEPDALFLATVGARYIMPKHVLEGVPVADLASSSQGSAPIGTGPYRLVEWARDESITYEAFDEYFGGRANITNYVWRIIPEGTVHITELLNNTVDIVPEVPADDFSALEGQEGVTTLRLPGVNMITLIMDTTEPLFQDKRVRQAFSYGINRQSIIDVVSGGLGDIVMSQVHPSLPEFNPNLTGQPFDPEQAKALLAEAGWTDDDGDGIVEAHGIEGIEDGTPFNFTLGTLPQPLYSLSAQVIQQNLLDIGVIAELNTVDFNIYFSEYVTTENPDFQAGLSGWFNLLFSPQVELSENFASFGSSNYRHAWLNEEYDQLVSEAPTTFDAAERNALYARAQEILQDELPMLFLIRPNNLIAYDADLVIPEVASQNDLFASVGQWSWAG